MKNVKINLKRGGINWMDNGTLSFPGRPSPQEMKEQVLIDLLEIRKKLMDAGAYPDEYTSLQKKIDAAARAAGMKE